MGGKGKDDMGGAPPTAWTPTWNTGGKPAWDGNGKGGGLDGSGAPAADAPSDNLFIGNLPSSFTTDQSLKDIFGQYGQIVQCKLLDSNAAGNRAALIRFS